MHYIRQQGTEKDRRRSTSRPTQNEQILRFDRTFLRAYPTRVENEPQRKFTRWERAFNDSPYFGPIESLLLPMAVNKYMIKHDDIKESQNVAETSIITKRTDLNV